MASRVTFGDIQGSAFISVLQFTLVNEIHLCCQDGLLPPPSLSLDAQFTGKRQGGVQLCGYSQMSC